MQAVSSGSCDERDEESAVQAYLSLWSATQPSCEDQCLSQDVVLDFAIHNLGSVDEPEGTQLTLRSFDGSAWSELSTFTLTAPLDAGSVVEGSVTLAATDLGSRLVTALLILKLARLASARCF